MDIAGLSRLCGFHAKNAEKVLQSTSGLEKITEFVIDGPLFLGREEELLTMNIM